MGGIHEGHSMIPDNSRKKLEQLRQEAALRAQLTQQYDKDMKKVPLDKMIPFSQWMDQRPKQMAKGGSAKKHNFIKHKQGEKVGGYDVGDKIKNYGSYSASGIDDIEEGIHRVPMSAFEVTHPNKLFYAKNDIDHVHRLAEQIKQNKYMDPLLIAMDKKGAYVLEGGHRLGAAHLLGMKEIPAMIGHEPEGYATGGTIHMKKGGKVDALMDELRKSIGNEPFDPIGTAKRNIQGAYDIAKQVPSNLKRLATDPVAYAKSLPEPSGEQIMNMLQPGNVGAMAGVIKPVGGNWLNRTVENELLPLRQKVGYSLDPEAQLKKLSAKYTPEVIASLDPNSRVDVQRMLKETAESAAMNKWIDSNLTNYVKKQMATPEDPVRKLAEQGITAFPIAEDPRFWNRMGESARGQYEGTPMAKSDLAKQWENRSDTMIGKDTAQQHQDMMHLAPGMYEKADEFIKKLSPETPLYKTSGAGTRFNPSDLGFDHIIDVLKQDVAAGRIRPEQLNKVSMEQAVRRTHELDQEMARRMRETAIKATEGFPVYKDYADKGYKWIELAKPVHGVNDPLPEGFRWLEPKGGYERLEGPSILDPERTRTYLGETKEDALKVAQERSMLGADREKRLEEALKYEGDTMGHCVGGYCPDVLEGRSRIFSLRDAKGEPHVTIETMPHTPTGKDVPPEIMRKWNNKASFPELQKYKFLNEFLEAEHPDIHAQMQQPKPDRIIQIKGKQNAKPKDEYLPYVQDFVRGGNWTDVGDLHNTGLYRADPAELGMYIPSDPRLKNLPGKRSEDLQRAKDAGLFGDQKYLTRNEWEDILRKQIESESGPLPPLPPEEGLKRGGKVRIAKSGDITSQDEMRLALTKRRGTTKS